MAIKRAALISFVLIASFLCACRFPPLPPGEAADATPFMPQYKDLEPAATYVSVTTPSPAPSPSVETVTIGAVGDIMLMTTQIANAKTGEGYDFSRSFSHVQGLFKSVDIMCANLELPLAGKQAGYTQPRPEAPEPSEDNPLPERPFQTFNGPDELAANLFGAGMDVLCTANNHSLDRGSAGLYRTVGVLREAGVLQTGTYLSEQDRAQPRIIDVNGMRIGFLAYTSSLNKRDFELSREERGYAVGRLNDFEVIQEEINMYRKAGAEFIVVFAHWGTEKSHSPDGSQLSLAAALAAAGADAIIGSHPHVVQPIQWIEAERGGTRLNVPVVYSLGNFISNMNGFALNCGLYVQLTISRSERGRPVVTDVGYLPLYCFKQKAGGATVHQALPCYQDMSGYAGALNRDTLLEAAKARELVIGVLGRQSARVLDESGG